MSIHVSDLTLSAKGVVDDIVDNAVGVEALGLRQAAQQRGDLQPH